jgi:hypothetical protein
VNVKGPAPVVALRDARHLQVTIQDHYQPVRHVEQGSVRREPRRNRLPVGSGFALEPSQLVDEPGPQVGGEVVSESNLGAFPVLLVGGVENSVRDGIVDPEMRHRKGGQFGLAESGQDKRLEDQLSLPAEQREPVPLIGADVGKAFALALPRVDGQRVEQGPFAGDGEQPDQLVFRHRPTLPARVRLLVRLRRASERIDGQSVRTYAPVAEGHQRVAVGVPGSGRHPFARAETRFGGEPLLQGLTAEITQRREGTVVDEPAQESPGVFAVNLRDIFRAKVVVVGGEVLSQRLVLLVADDSLLCRHDVRLDQFGLALQVGQHWPGGGFVTAAGRLDANDSQAVAVLGDEEGRFCGNAILTALARGQGSGSSLPLAVFPTSEALALANEDFRTGRQRSRRLFPEHGTHVSPTFLPRSQFQPKIGGQPIRNVQPETSLAGDEA